LALLNSSDAMFEVGHCIKHLFKQRDDRSQGGLWWLMLGQL
jgi:hypothetical protein